MQLQLEAFWQRSTIIPPHQRLLYCSQSGGMPIFQRPCRAHWKIMVHMSRAYLIKKQMSQTFWYYAIKHSARMMSMIPGKYHGKLAPPFMLIHGVCPNPRTWLPFFLVCYFHHKKDSDFSHSKLQAHTMDGIILSQSPTSNAIYVYYTCNQHY
jgi:hypothetical protein